MTHPPCRARGDFGRWKAAFSYVELLIVIAILAIAAMLVIPMIGQSDATRLRAAGELLIADLEYAQLQSMGDTLQRCVIVFSPQGDRYHLARHDTPTTPMADPTTGQPYVTRFGHGRAHALGGLRIEAANVGGDAQLGYTALGALDQGDSPWLTLHAGSLSLTVTIDPATGEPRLAANP